MRNLVHGEDGSRWSVNHMGNLNQSTGSCRYSQTPGLGSTRLPQATIGDNEEYGSMSQSVAFLQWKSFLFNIVLKPITVQLISHHFSLVSFPLNRRCCAAVLVFWPLLIIKHCISNNGNPCFICLFPFQIPGQRLSVHSDNRPVY